MKSRISSSKLTAFRKDITRFMPLWMVYFIGGTLVMLTICNNGRPGGNAEVLGEIIGGFGWINLIYACLCAQLLFGDLYNSRLCNALHAMPLRREHWFVSHIAAGLCFSLVPNLVGILPVMFRLGEFWYTAFFWLAGMELHFLFFFGLAVFSVMCTGNRFAMVAVYSIINFFALIALWLVSSIYEPLMYGVSLETDGFLRFCPVMQLSSSSDFFRIDTKWSGATYNYSFMGFGDSWGYLGILALIGVVLGGLALLMYRRRSLESAGDFMAVNWLKPVFAVVYTLCVGAVFAAVGELFGAGYVVFLIVGLALGWFTGQMLLQRTAKVFRGKTFLGFGALALVLLISLGVVKADPTGVTRWVPELDQVESVAIDAGYNENTVTSQSPQRLQQVLDIHRLIIEEGEPDVGEGDVRIYITYTLKDGRKVSRMYDAPQEGIFSDALKQFLDAPESVLGYEDWDTFLQDVWKIGVDSDDYYETYDREQIQGLLEAIKLDCQAGTMTQSWIFWEDFSDQKYWIYIEMKDSEGSSWDWGVTVFSDCVNTVRWIKENLE